MLLSVYSERGRAKERQTTSSEMPGTTDNREETEEDLGRRYSMRNRVCSERPVIENLALSKEKLQLCNEKPRNVQTEHN